MNVLLSIRPKYVEAIMNGEKRYEFRKIIFKNREVEEVYIYSTAPVKKIVGSFLIGDIIEDSPERLWEEFKKCSGISDSEFFSYFNGNAKGFAIEIESVRKFEEPIDPRDHYPNFVPPQSFSYIETPFCRN